MEYSIQGNIRLVLFSLLSPLLLAGEFQCLKLSLFQQNYVRANSRWDEIVCKWIRAKKHREHNPVYSNNFFFVRIIESYFLQEKTRDPPISH